MSENTSQRPPRRLVRAAGWFYLLIILTSILSLIFIGGKYTVMGDNAASVAKMSQNGMLVRINAAYEMLMFSAVIVLAVLLFEITKSINSALARTAMLLRIAEALMGYIGIILSLGVLSATRESAGADAVSSLAILLLNLKDIAYMILSVCISMGTVLFFVLLQRARYLPSFLTLWGIFGFGLMLIAGLMQITDVPAGDIVNAVAAGLVILFELVVGLWLIVKGIND